MERKNLMMVIQVVSLGVKFPPHFSPSSFVLCVMEGGVAGKKVQSTYLNTISYSTMLSKLGPVRCKCKRRLVADRQSCIMGMGKTF